MAMTWWRYKTRRFSVDGLQFTVGSSANTDGLCSTLSMLAVEQANDFTPMFGEEAIRNHHLACDLPDGRRLEVELGYIGSWATGIIARLDGLVVFESHPGRTPQFPEKHRDQIRQASSFGDAMERASAASGKARENPFKGGIFAKENRLPFAIDIATGLLFYIVAKLTDLQTAALAGVAVGAGLVIFQRVTKIDVTGGLALFGIVMLAISAGLALAFADDEWIKMRGTITGLIGASFFLLDGWRGGPYIGKGLARYMPYSDISAGKFATAMGLIGMLMAGLNYTVAKMVSTDTWLFYTTFIDFPIIMGLAILAIRFARSKA
jgi:intracellular septation protein A